MPSKLVDIKPYPRYRSNLSETFVSIIDYHYSRDERYKFYDVVEALLKHMSKQKNGAGLDIFCRVYPKNEACSDNLHQARLGYKHSNEYGLVDRLVGCHVYGPGLDDNPEYAALDYGLYMAVFGKGGLVVRGADQIRYSAFALNLLKQRYLAIRLHYQGEDADAGLN